MIIPYGDGDKYGRVVRMLKKRARLAENGTYVLDGKAYIVCPDYIKVTDYFEYMRAKGG